VRPGDAVVLLDRATVRCRGRAMASAPLLGSERVRITLDACRSRPAVSGPAMLLSRTGRTLTVRRSGRTLRWSTHGRGLRHLHSQVRTGGRWRAVHGRRATLPAGARGAALRVRATLPGGRVARAFTRVIDP